MGNFNCRQGVIVIVVAHSQSQTSLMSHGMGQLGEEHRGKMAHHTEGAGLGLHAGLACVAVDQSSRNEVESA